MVGELTFAHHGEPVIVVRAQSCSVANVLLSQIGRPSKDRRVDQSDGFRLMLLDCADVLDVCSCGDQFRPDMTTAKLTFPKLVNELVFAPAGLVDKVVLLQDFTGSRVPPILSAGA